MRWPPPEPLARRLVGIVAAFAAIALAVSIGIDWTYVLTPWLLPTEVSFLMGILVGRRRPAHPIGWLFLWFVAVIHISFVLLALGQRLEGDAAAWWNAAGWSLNTLASAWFVPLSLLLFPDGRVPSRRWRLLVYITVLAGLLGGAAALINGGWGGDPATVTVDSPLRAASGEVGDALSQVFFQVFILAWVGSAAGLVMRARRARAEERQQLKWIAVAAAYAAVVAVVVYTTLGGAVISVAAETVVASAFASVPAAAALAVLRYRLWDIDVVIRRSVVVALLAAFVTLVYAAVVIGIGALLPIDDLLLSVAATALVAVLFAPLRDAASRLANRLVYGQRATPFEVLAGLSEQMAAALPEDRLLEAMAQRLADGTGAARTAVWLRRGDRLEPAAGWPETPHADPVPLEPGGPLPDLPDAEDAAPVLHAGELLGALTAKTARGEGLVPTERALLADLAASAGLVLRKAALDRDLRARLDELAASRRRVVAAEDAARRRLERDLHDGAQQQLVALRVQLGLARTVAAREGADDLAPQLDALAATAEETVDAVRGVAHGIYPPLLAAEGLPAALRAAARRAAVPVEVDVAEELGRHAEPVEAACYFATVAALDAAAEARATAATIVARTAGDRLTVTVTSDAPLDPALFVTLHDRLDTLDGDLTVATDLDGGRLQVSVPITAGVAHADPAWTPHPVGVGNGGGR